MEFYTKKLIPQKELSLKLAKLKYFAFYRNHPHSLYRQSALGFDWANRHNFEKPSLTLAIKIQANSHLIFYQEPWLQFLCVDAHHIF